ncbi:hypothetical protein DYB25_003369 [Aphanomyces astaci]|uniref:Calponin-homology (CH) domain-containing protein n=1 Tax=Aphanomyces astaci TaxID=112090 RepID=A0A397ANA8_APHAT|nr:hypothetical protein DYB25_003369 [Aphanomyces astaci]RHY55086.1 hypothetical protein DYB38_006747 [Aphanomyces astaci]RHY70950.1 hypothetical protein DYB30_007896 [Aphanomyces astaci]RHY78145.1 hypothetical protein DYB34_005417 [Aphanomyces astaci]RHY85779.1 hypothetical protein DYB26_005071 [Aphanomyces astaci]
MQAAPQMQRRPSNIQGGDEFWIDVQKKAFTRWANSYLSDRAQVITDLYTDLGDGLRLISLLELLTDAPFPSYTKEPRFRIHKLENLNMVFGFLAKEHVMVTNIGSSDILDGNGKLILGLMWTIIKRYQVGDIAVDGVSGKEGLLLWCNQLLAPLHFHVSNFTTNWSNGVAFCYLVHALQPALLPNVVDWCDLHSAMENLATAFSLLEAHFAIPPLLSPEDLQGKVDEKSVLTGTTQWTAAFESAAHVPTWATPFTKRDQPLVAKTQMSFAALGPIMALLYPAKGPIHKPSTE